MNEGYGRGRGRRARRAWAAALAVSLSAGAAPGARAAEGPGIGVELNKLEPQPKGCRIYILADNPGPTAFSALKLDLAILKKDGTIDRRVAFDLAPLRPSKRSVKLFDANDLPCESFGSLLLNDVIECRSGDAALGDCLDRLKLSSRVPGVDLGR